MAMLDELPCAAKLLHLNLVLDPEKPRNRIMFEQECRFLSEIRHPNIVQYLAVTQDEESGLPIPLMELMDDSLTHFLEQSEEPLSYHVQVNISHDIALAVAFLHLNHIIHRDLSSNNVLLIGAGSRAKVTDFGMSKLTELNPRMTGLTMCPGTPVYMSPEALLNPPVYTEKLDCFQIGVLMLQTMIRKFPDPGQASNRVQDARFPTGWVNVPIPEVQRRHTHLSLVAETHPMLCLVKDCLKDTDTERPSAQQICRRLSALKEVPQYAQSREERGGKKEEGGRESEIGEREGEAEEREKLIHQLKEDCCTKEIEISQKKRENEDLMEVARERERKIKVKEGEIETLRKIAQEKEREVREKEEKARKQKEEVREREEVESLYSKNQEREREVRAKEREIESLKRIVRDREREVRDGKSKVTEKNEVIQSLQHLLHEKARIIHQLQQAQQFAFYSCAVSGPGLQSATANYPTRVMIELSKQNVAAELIVQSTSPQAAHDNPVSKSSAEVIVIPSSLHEVSYTAIRQGSHKLHVRVSGNEINGSPFTVIVYPDPTQLGPPVRVVKDVNNPHGISINSHGEMIVTESSIHAISVFDNGGQRVWRFGSYGDRQDEIKCPASIAVDCTDNIYVSSKHKLQKFTSSGELVKCIGRKGSEEGEFNDPSGVAIHSNQVYVCDTVNHRIQVLDLDLNFIGSIGSHGSGIGEFDCPFDVAFDTSGSMYIVEFNNNRVQVVDSSGQFVRVFGQKGEGRLSNPTALHIADKHVYVSNWRGECIAVYDTSGQYITSFGRRGEGKGEFKSPFCITSCVNGFIYVCDHDNNRVQVF